MKKFKLILFVSLFISTVSCSSEKQQEKSSSIKKESISSVKNDRDDSDESLIISNTRDQAEVIDTETKHIIDEENHTNVAMSDDVDSSLTRVIIPDSPVEVIDSYNFHEYKDLNRLLNKFVSSSGRVNYKGIKSESQYLNAIIKEFESNYPESSWSKNQKLSYWINAYNIYTIKLIVDNYPTSSITKITEKPWDKKFIKLGGNMLSLNQIENEIIRKKFNEPRIHFALNCASKSCPVLLNSAYTPSNLQSKLTSQTKRFLNDISKNKFDSKEIQISKLFEWYAADFTKNGSIVDFINKYRTEQLDSPEIVYMEYSWDLNN